MFWLSVSPEIKGIRYQSIFKFCFPHPLSHTWWSQHRMDPSHHSMQVHPSLPLLMPLQLLSPLSLQHEQSFKISLNLCLPWQLLLTHIIWTDSILSQFVLHDLMKKEGGVLSPSISNFSVAWNSCHWQPSTVFQFLGATNFSSRYPAFEAAVRQTEIEQLARKDPRLSLFSDGTRIQEISPVVKWEESVFDFHFPTGNVIF